VTGVTGGRYSAAAGARAAALSGVGLEEEAAGKHSTMDRNEGRPASMCKHRLRCIAMLIRVELGHARWGGPKGCGEFQTSCSGTTFNDHSPFTVH
jgi:hypothetical protein